MKRLLFSKKFTHCALFALLLFGFEAQLAEAQVFDPFIGPVIRITSPANYATFYTPVDIPIFTFVTGEVRASTNVHIFAGATDLGEAFDLGAAASTRPPGVYLPLMPTPFPRAGTLYCLVWTNPPAGDYVLKAVAKSNATPQLPQFGISRTSAPVNITVISPTTVHSNLTDIVSISATDPIAIAGTNSWIWPGITNTLPTWTNWPPANWQFTTNWGPKNGAFTVRRMGDATAALTINYGVSGTASNGVDYLALPGSVTIPAGTGYAVIPVVPIDHGASNQTKTVILTLAADTATVPKYILGFQNRAEVIILGKTWPRPLPFFPGDGSFHVNTPGPDGAWFSIESSTDMQNWTPVGTNQVVQGSIDFVDPNGGNGTAKFYRTIPMTEAPEQ